MFLQYRPFPIIQTGASQFAVIQHESQGMYEVQSSAGIGTKAYDIAGVGRDLRLVQHNMKH
jgi:hypothetical protein